MFKRQSTSTWGELSQSRRKGSKQNKTKTKIFKRLIDHEKEQEIDEILKGVSLREVLGDTPEVSDEELNPNPILNTEEQMKIMKKVNASVQEQIGSMAHFEP